MSTPPAIVDITPAALNAKLTNSSAKLTILNVWATWCDPCREELPDFLKLSREYKDRGVELVLLSGDFAAERAGAEKFLQSIGVNFQSYRKDAGDAELIDALHKDWSGTLPATFFYTGGKQVHFVEGKMSYTALEREVLRVLGTAP